MHVPGAWPAATACTEGAPCAAAITQPAQPAHTAQGHARTHAGTHLAAVLRRRRVRRALAARRLLQLQPQLLPQRLRLLRRQLPLGRLLPAPLHVPGLPHAHVRAAAALPPRAALLCPPPLRTPKQPCQQLRARAGLVRLAPLPLPALALAAPRARLGLGGRLQPRVPLRALPLLGRRARLQRGARAVVLFVRGI